MLRAETIVVQLNIGRSQRVKSYFYQVQGRLKPSIKHFKNILNTYITSYKHISSTFPFACNDLSISTFHISPCWILDNIFASEINLIT